MFVRQLSALLALVLLLAACSNTFETEMTFADLEWSKISKDKMTWYTASKYCLEIDARLPSISELRKTIINCPSSSIEGACAVSSEEPVCLSESCWTILCGCDGTAETYSVMGDDSSKMLWSSSQKADEENRAWGISYDFGKVVTQTKDGYGFQVRCVRP